MLVAVSLPFPGLIVYMNRGAGGAGGGGGIGKMFSIGKVKGAVNPKDLKVKVTFKDVAGCDEAKVCGVCRLYDAAHIPVQPALQVRAGPCLR